MKKLLLYLKYEFYLFVTGIYYKKSREKLITALNYLNKSKELLKEFDNYIENGMLIEAELVLAKSTLLIEKSKRLKSEGNKLLDKAKEYERKLYQIESRIKGG